MRNPRVLLGLIFGLTMVALLVALPRVPIKVNYGPVKLDSYIGGYYLNFFQGKFVLDLREAKRGLDLQGGVRVVLRADMSKINDADKEAALESAKTVIARRVDLLGVAEPVIQTSKVGGDFRIIVELPGVSDVSSAIALIGQTAQLKFKELKADKPYETAKFQEYFFDAEAWQDAGVSGADLKGADVVFDQSVGSSGNAQIRLRFSDEGRRKFSEVAKRNVNKPVAIYLDEGGLPISMPVVNPDLAQGVTTDPVITGSFTAQEASNLSISLRAGALPVPVEILEQKVVGATLGSESIHRSIIAGTIGILLVSLFMILNYGKLGVMADLALLVYGILTFALFKLIPVTLTLPGIAGFILSIGMAVDANILIFERVKEELSWGRPFNLALKLGFERAWPSIRDSNFSSLLTCAVLFYFGSGLVRGFALTLAVGIFVSMFTAILVTKNLVTVFYLQKKQV